jgi:D-3-phosphoglycerate dehydrogenase / 2-oxoglutarate reductase
MIDILVAEDVWGGPFDRLATRLEVLRDPGLWRDPDRLKELVSRSRCLVVRNRTNVDRQILEASAGRLRVVARAGAGVDNVAVDVADELNIAVVAAGGANARSVAELALGFAIALARRIPALDRETRAGAWERDVGVELGGRTWGVVGLGRTGVATAELALGFGLRVLGYDPLPGGSAQQQAIERVGLTDLLSESDVVSLHVPLTAATRSLVDREFLASMKPGAYLINVARGEVVNESDLAKALKSGLLGGAALDVRVTEPPGPGAFDALPNVILSPHVAGLTTAAQERVVETICDDIERLFAGREALGAVGKVRAIS